MIRLGEPAAVLLYHRVAAPPRDTHELCVHPDRFAAHMEHLRRHERVVPLYAARRRAWHRQVVVTFDDGYADNAHEARAILEAAGLPATYFVAAGLVDSAQDIWWDELELLLLDGQPRQRHLRVTIDERPLVADIGGDAARIRAHEALHRRLRRLRRVDIDDVLAQVRVQLDVPPAARESHRFMTADELREVAASSNIEIGGHGMTHQQLSILTEEEQRAEIVDGRAVLQAMTGNPVRAFAYPYGGRDAFDATSEALVASAGYEMACAGWAGVVRPRSPRYRLPRFVVGDWDVDEFAGRLDRWFHR